MKKENILHLVSARKYECERLGQAVFNICVILFPEKANEIRGTAKDCFHVDGRIDAFLDYVLDGEQNENS